MRLSLDAGILAKDAMRYFGKSRTVRSSRVPERFLGKSREKFLVKLFWEKFGEVNFVFIVIEEFYRAKIREILTDNNLRSSYPSNSHE